MRQRARPNPDSSGRPIYATDVTDPANPEPCPQPIDTGHNDGVSGYVHDVQVDAAGVAWVSGEGGVRGYWTERRAPRPAQPARSRPRPPATPIPYAGAARRSPRRPRASCTTLARLHAAAAARQVTPGEGARATRGSKRDLARRKARKRRPAPRRATVAPARKPAAARRADAQRRPARHRGEHRHRLRDVAGASSAYDLARHPTARASRTRRRPATACGCSTPGRPRSSRGSERLRLGALLHLARRRDHRQRLLQQGVRFLDTCDPTDIRQVGYCVTPTPTPGPPTGTTATSTWPTSGRGVDVLRFRGAPAAPARCAPRLSPAAAREQPGLRFSRQRSAACAR